MSATTPSPTPTPTPFVPLNRGALSPQERTRILDLVRELFWDFSRFSASEFRRDDLGQYGFSLYMPVIDRTLAFVNYALSPADHDLLPDRELSALWETLQSIRTHLLELKKFAPRATSADPIPIRDELVERLRLAHEAAFRRFAPVIAGLSRASTRGERLKDDVLSTRTEVEKLLTEARLMAHRVRDTAQLGGVAVHAGIFGDAALGHEESAVRWLRITVFLASVTGFLAVLSVASLFLFRAHYGKLTIPLLAHLAIAKLVVFSLMFSAIVWCGRMYRAHRHNHVVNRHRQLALISFDTFVKSAEDQHIRNAILLQATQCIFGSQPTAYVEDEHETAASSPHIVEIVRSLVETKGGA
jgi:hypothetical protein